MESAREAARRGRVEQLKVLQAFEAGKPVVFRVHNDPKGFPLSKEQVVTKSPSGRRAKFRAVDMMMDSAMIGDVDQVKKLIEAGVDPNARDPDGMTALHHVCVENHLNIASFLVLKGAELEARDDDWWTPLHAAASAGNWRIANYLIGQGADPRKHNSEGDLPIDVVSDSKVENILTQEMERLNVLDDQLDALREADQQAMDQAVDKIIASGAHNKKNAEGAAPLHIAACNGYMKSLKKLCKTPGIDVETKDPEGNTPLHLASFFQQYEAAMVLVGAGASMDARNSHNERPIVLTEDTTMIRLLTALEKKAKVEAPKSNLQRSRVSSIRHSSRARKAEKQKKDAKAERASLPA